MKITQWLVLGKSGIKAVRKTKPSLDWNEIAVKINLEVPDQLFVRPTIEARIIVGDVPSNVIDVEDVIVNTKELIEQQTGIKVNFTFVPVE